jgi:hypothetical protein
MNTNYHLLRCTRKKKNDGLKRMVSEYISDLMEKNIRLLYYLPMEMTKEELEKLKDFNVYVFE